MNLVLFDLDHTLISGDSDLAWSRYLIDVGAVDAEFYEQKRLSFYESYLQGTLIFDDFIGFQLETLMRFPRSQLDVWHGGFMQQIIRPMIGGAALDLVRRHRREGDHCLMVTATNNFLAAPIARVFDIEHVIATEFEEVDGTFTGRIIGTAPFRDGKVARIESWLASCGMDWSDFGATCFYSDSWNDLPLLSRVSNPVAVDPDAILRAHAETRGWPIISLRDGPMPS